METPQELMLMQMMLQQQGGMPREHPLSRAFGGVPMYNGTPIHYNQMFDLSGIPGFNPGSPTGMMAGMLMQGMLPAMMGPKFMPGQLFPTQNFADHRNALNYFTQRRQAISRAATADVNTYFRMIRGMSRMRGADFKPGGEQERSAMRFAQDISAITPILGDMMPETMDQIHGIRGSSQMMARSMFEAGRYQFDPASGRLGMSGDSAGQISSEVFNMLYGPGADLTRMRGLGAGRMGQVYEELVKRGYGTPTMLNEGEARSQLAKELSKAPADIRNGELLQHRRRLLGDTGAGETDTLPLQDAAEKMERAVKRMDSPQMDAAMRSFNATKTAKIIEGMAGAVSAMRDIFGDMGRPNAPMVELMNGLQALTQGGLAHMNPKEIEKSVRHTYAIAKYTGLGIEGLMGFAGTANQMLAQQGMNSAFAPQIANSAALFGFAFGATGQPRNFGALDREQASQLNMRLRANALQSSQASRLAAVMRFADEHLQENGKRGFKEGSEAEKIAAAIRAGESTYDFGNRRGLSVFKSSAEMQRILELGGIGRNEAATAIMADPKSVQRIAHKYNLQDIIQPNQGMLDFAPTMGMTFTKAAAVSLGDVKGLSIQQRNTMSQAIGRSLIAEAMRLNDENPELFSKGKEGERNEELAKRLRAKLGNQLNGISHSQLTNLIGNALQQGDAFIQREGSPMRGLKSFIGGLQMTSKRTQKVAQRARMETRAAAELQEAFSGIGQAGLAARMSDYLQDVGPGGGSIQDFLYRSLGGISMPEVQQAGMAMMNRLNELQDEYSNAKTQEARNAALQKIKDLAPAISTIVNDKSLKGLRESDKEIIRKYQGKDAKGNTPRSKFLQSQQKYTELVNSKLGNREDVRKARGDVTDAREKLRQAEDAVSRGVPGAVKQRDEARKHLEEVEAELSKIENAAQESLSKDKDVMKAHDQMEKDRDALNKQNRDRMMPEIAKPSTTQLRLIQSSIELGRARDKAIEKTDVYKEAKSQFDKAESDLKKAKDGGDKKAIEKAEEALKKSQANLSEAYDKAHKQIDDNPDQSPEQKEYTRLKQEAERLHKMPGAQQLPKYGQEGQPGLPGSNVQAMNIRSQHTTMPNAVVEIKAKELKISQESLPVASNKKDADGKPTRDPVRGEKTEITGVLTIEGDTGRIRGQIEKTPNDARS